jgi:hypothetical protein
MRRIRTIRFIAAICALGALARPASAQRVDQRFDVQQDTITPLRGGWTVVRVAKWGTLFASAGTLAYGFTQNRAADREYEDIERLCQSTPAACETKPDSDEYADPALETRYQNVIRRDDRARLALLAGQIGLAASVLLFILDLSGGDALPHDIPYDPRPLRVSVGAHTVTVGFGLEVR